MVYFVSRQMYWYSGEQCVEVAQGGLDYANADMLVAKYQGEGREYQDPREAVAIAIDICKAWRKDLRSSKPYVSIGATGGFTIEFERKTFKECIKRANEVFEKLEKCAHCGDILGKNTYSHDECFDDEKFCSENCAENDCYNRQKERLAYGY